MRIVIVGRRSFVAGRVGPCAANAGLEVISLAHDTPLESVLRPDDTAINFSLHPDYRSKPYDAGKDCDLAVALASRKAGARFVMLSTRRVYPEADRWGAVETSAATGDETAYGKNKARTEAAIRDTMGDDAAILRLSNVFGHEYDATESRRTFFAQALTSLKKHGRIVLDMNPRTRRDFVPVDRCAAAIVAVASSRKSGIFNVGCGFPVACGDLAQWVIDGFGSGEIAVVDNGVRDEFFLNVGKWRAAFGELVGHAELQSSCEELGRRLR